MLRVVLLSLWVLIFSSVDAFEVCEIVASHGYPCEQHEVHTADGWTLKMHRLPTGLDRSRPRLGVVMYQHGLTDSSAGVLLLSPSAGLAYLLADAGYDVWLGNNRGNGQSMTHAKYNSKQKEFWAFTFDEFAQYDLPAQIYHVLNQTHQANLTYIGHSQGTMQAFIGFQDHRLASRINLFVAMAPVVYVKHTQSALVKLMAGMRLDVIFQLFGLKAFTLPDFIGKLIPGTCTLLELVCDAAVQIVMGPSTHFNYSGLPYITKYWPAATSVQNMAHWAQFVRSDVFQKYDFGSAKKNMEKYNQTTPPLYDLSRIPASLPVALFSGGHDYLAPPYDVMKIVSQLPRGSLVHTEQQDTYAHADFILAGDAQQLMYPAIFKLLNKYGNTLTQK